MNMFGRFLGRGALPILVVAGLIVAGLTLGASAQAEPKEKLTIAMSSEGLLYGPLYAALEMGFFEEEGLEVELVDFKGGSKALAAVAGGSLPIYVGATASVFNAANKGAPLEIIAPILNQYDTNFVLQGEIARQKGLILESSFEDKAKALEGLTIGVTSPGSGTDQITRYMAEQVGLDPERDITITFLGGTSDVLAAFERKRIDGFFISAPTAQLAEARADGVILMQPARGDVPPLKDLLYVSIAARTDWLEDQPEVAQKFIRGYQRGLDALHADPAAAGEAVYQGRFERVDHAVFEKAWNDSLPAYVDSVVVDQERARRVVDFFNKSSDSEILFNADLIDTDLAQSAE